MAVYGGGDVEIGAAGKPRNLMRENPNMRWAFIRKVYCILCVQLGISFGIAFAMVFTIPVRDFMRSYNGIYVLLALVVVCLIFSIMLYCYQRLHPWNYVLMFIFTILTGLTIGAVACQKKADAVLISAGLALVVAFTLTLFTFFASLRGMDFSFLFPFLLCGTILLLCFALIRVFVKGSLITQIFSVIAALIFSGFIIYDTDDVIKRYEYDEYIMAASSLFLDIINLFLSMLGMGGSGGH